MSAEGDEHASSQLRSQVGAARSGSPDEVGLALDAIAEGADRCDPELRASIVAWWAASAIPFARLLRPAIALVRSAVRSEAEAVWGPLLVLSRERAADRLGVAVANAIARAVVENPALWIDGEAATWMARTGLPEDRAACAAALPRAWAVET